MLGRLMHSLGRLIRTDVGYVLRAGTWVHLSSVTVSLFSLLLYIVLAHYVPKEVYGTYQYLLSLGALIGALSLSGMTSAVARAVARGADGALRQAVTLQLRWSVVPVLVALSVAAYYYAQGNLVLALGMAVVGAATPLLSTYNIYAAYLIGKQDFRRSFFLGLLQSVVYYGTLITVALTYPVVLALLATSVFSQALGYVLCYRLTVRTYRPPSDEHGDVMRYGKHLSAMNFLTTLANQADSLLAFHFLGAAPLAVYAFATAIPDRLGLFKSLSFIALPRLAGRDSSAIRRTLPRRLLFATLGMGVIAGAYALAAPYIFALLFPTYVEAVPYTQLYAVTVVTGVSGFLATTLIAQELVKRLYLYTLLAPVIQLGLLVVGVLMAGLWGLVIAKILATATASLLAFGLVMHERRGP